LPNTTHPSPEGATLAPLTLVLGGARSGKSRFAEAMIAATEQPAIYLATAEARDDEMRARIAHHRDRRGEQWTTVEEPLEIVECLRAETRGPVLVDCLTLWLSNLIEAERDIAVEIDRLIAALPRIRIPVVMVANEVGLGIVPDNALARRFRDDAGRLNQRVAAVASRVVFLAAGLPLSLKG
jgi:adenosylcobinamide kinase/adenosylcobinamide-phosphate guanylyltransferase